MATIVALIITLIMLPYPPSDIPIQTLFISMGVLGLLAAIIANGYILIPLQKAEKNFTPRITEAIQRKKRWKIAHFCIFIYPLLSFAMLLQFNLPKEQIFALWLIITGLTIDCYFHLFHVVTATLNPFAGLQLLSQHAAHNAKSATDTELCHWIETISDVALKSIGRSNISLCSRAIEEIESLISFYLERHSPLAGSIDENRAQHLNYTVLFTLQRLDQLACHALNHDLEIVATQVILSLGKITYSITRYFPTLTAPPIDLIGKITLNSQDIGFQDVAIKAAIILQQTGKAILEDDPKMELPIQDIYFNIIDRLEEISQKMYRIDRSINIALLTQPFKEIQALFKEGEYAKHPDAGPISVAAENVMGSFDALETLLKTMPNISSEGEEREEESKA